MTTEAKTLKIYNTSSEVSVKHTCKTHQHLDVLKSMCPCASVMPTFPFVIYADNVALSDIVLPKTSNSETTA